MAISRRAIKEFLKQSLRMMFEAGQHAGIDILPRHFYSEVPDIRALRSSNHWKRPFSMIGVQATDIESQLAFVHECCPPAIREALKQKDVHLAASEANGETGFGPIEADFLYAFVATKRPSRIFQIGCGVSTAVCLTAAEDVGYHPRITCVEPYPNAFLRQAALDGRIQLIESKVELLALSAIEELEGDLLFFVDSSHTLGPAGEVTRIILEMLPRLKTGAWIHFHDITFPYDYDRHLLRSTIFFQHESALLHAFLAFNQRFTLKASLSMLHYAAAPALAASLQRYRPAANDAGLAASDGHYPSSAYLRVAESFEQ